MEQDRSAEPAPTAAVDPPPGPDSAIAGLARHGVDYARAWGDLVVNEAALAKVNLYRLVIGTLLVPAIAVGVIIGLDALLAAAAFELLHHWMLAVGSIVLLNVGLLFGLLRMLRAWWRSLSLPQSREALIRLWNANDNVDPDRQGADTRSAG
jgi:hypothetical protein